MHDGRVVLHQNDCRDVLRGLADNSIDSVVTDPPYALVSIQKRFGKPGSAPAKDVYGRGAAGFMGKSWDTGEVAFSEEFWAEVLRVLKPGGHVVAFSGTRTYHRMAVAIEDAGFEIRDQLGWVYGSGFPKSHDVSKGIAKRRVEDVEPVRVVCRFIRAAMDEAGLKSKDLTQHFGDCNPRLIDHWAARDTDSQPALPTNEQWDGLVDALSLSGRDGFEFISIEVSRLNGRKGTHGERWAEAEIIGEVASTPAGFGDLRFEGDRTIRSLDEEASAWQGWGTALKPAWEPICLARKPLIGTVAENVLEHGTGAINIDGSRAPGGNEQDLGRWPANILHDGSEEVLAAFPNAKGQQGYVGPKHGERLSKGIYGDFGARPDSHPRVEAETSAARFFYCAKASRADRDAGLEAFPEVTVSGGGGTSSEISDAYGALKANRRNVHPTVKPTTLMQWLCRLITPPGGIILDPFMGSGSTGKAALLEGFQFVGCEREDEYMPIAAARIAWAIGATSKEVVETGTVPANDNRPADLFGVAA
nr:DNA methyltransferase [Agrobacterium tumefaciens]